MKPEAVVVGSGLNALGVVRSLAAEGIAITLVDAAPGSQAMHTRFAKKERYAAATGLVDHLLNRKTRSERPVLFLTQEASVAAVSGLRGRLQDRYRFLLAPVDLLAQLMDKSRFQSLAAQQDFPVPRAVILDAAREPERAAGLTYPCILKPVAKSDVWEHRYQKAYRFESFERLKEFCLALEAQAPPLIVQEWIEGTDADVYFTLVYRDEAGRTCVSFTGRKLRQWPPQVGGTASCIAAPEAAAELSDLTRRFFDVAGFVGMGSMEYKRDPRTNRFVMVEPTVGRSDYQQEVSTLNGVNVVRAAYRSLAGLPPLADVPVSGLKLWRDANADERSRLAQPALEMPEPASRAQRVDALFRMNDPGPWLTALGERVRNRIAKLRA